MHTLGMARPRTWFLLALLFVTLWVVFSTDVSAAPPPPAAPLDNPSVHEPVYLPMVSAEWTVNLALHRPVVASSTEGTTGVAPGMAVDGNGSTRWSSQVGDPQWIYVDLGQTYSFTRVRLTWESAYARGYDIQVSANAVTWTTLFSTNTGDGGVDDVAAAGTGRYVRMYGRQRGTTFGYSLWEFEVFNIGYPPPTATPPPSTPAPPTATPPAGWRLVWSEEFNGAAGTAPDPAHWDYHTGCTGWGNNELQNYTNRLQNAALDQGDLVLTARQESLGGCAYTSAKLVTQYRGDWLYGRVDVRARLPYGQGLWPAIWLMPTDSVYGIWPNSGEIDIMENLGNDTNVVHGTAHWTDALGTHLQSGASYRLPNNGSFAEGYHVFSLEWEPGVLRWYVDGNQYHTVYQGAPFDQRFFLILNVAVGGDWPGPPNGTTVFPQTMRVDYVHVYQR